MRWLSFYLEILATIVIPRSARDFRKTSSPILRRLHRYRRRPNAIRSLPPRGVAIGLIILLSDGGDIAGFKDVHAAGHAQRCAKLRLTPKERHAIAQVAGIVGLKPQAAAAVRRGVAIARHVRGQQGFALPHALQ